MGRFTNIYRATYTQAVIIGTLSFTLPGIWSAIASLGAGGLQTTLTANTANAMLSGIMFVTAPIFSILINKVGIKPIISIGTIGYVIWSAGLYQNSKDGTQWLIMFGAAACGVSASAFWTGEATVAILYPDDQERGLFIATWQIINKIGGLISGSITLALNFHASKSGGISLNTYVALLSIQCLGFPLSFLLSPPEKVIRKDGKKLKTNITNQTWKERVYHLCMVLKKKEVLCLLPLFLTNQWYNTWKSNFMAKHFSVRVRALNSLLQALIPAATDIIAGYLLDLKVRKSLKVKVSWLVTLTLMIGMFIFFFIIQLDFDANPESGIDWTGNDRYARSFIPFQVFKVSSELVFNWAYWVIGAYLFLPSEITYVSGLLRAAESLGTCFSWTIGTVNDNDMVSLAVAAGMFFASVPSATYIAFQATDDALERFESEDQGELDDEFQNESADIEQGVSSEKKGLIIESVVERSSLSD